MKIVDRYILREVGIPILLTISMFTFIFLIDIIVYMIEGILVKGISFFVVLRMLSFYIPPILNQVIPIGLFLGLMIGISKINKNMEIVAMNSIGMSVKRILKPILLLSFFIIIFLCLLQEYIIPNSFDKLQKINNKISGEATGFVLREKIFMKNMENYSLYVNKVEKRNKAKEIILIEKEESSIFPTVLVGKSLELEDDKLIITDADFISFNDNGSQKLFGSFRIKQTLVSSFMENMKIKIKDIESKSISEVIRYLKTNNIDSTEKKLYNIEINRKLGTLVSTLLFSILGLLLPINHNRSFKKSTFPIAVFVIFLHMVLLNLGMVMASKNTISVTFGLWGSNILLLIFTMYTYNSRME